MNEEKLKNGLTILQAEKIKEKLKKVNVRTICKEKGIPYMNVINTCRGTSSQFDQLQTVLKIANKHIARRKKFLEALPL